MVPSFTTSPRSRRCCSSLAGGLVAAGLLLTGSAASAQTAPRGYDEQRSAAGASVVFLDDPMTAAGAGPVGALLTPRSSAARLGLLRPRTHFVAEMLKSVESL